MEITFLGGAGGVTGSKHLVETGTTRFILDCGLFQGLPDIRERNRQLPFPPESINFVILSHAHLDHCGMLPLLVKRGFSGPIYATSATRDSAQFIMSDAARIEEADAAYRAKHKWGAPDDREPLFTPDDVPAVMKLFKTLPYAHSDNNWQALTPDIKLKFYDAGHILGSAVTVLEITENGAVKTLGFSGDLGAPRMPLLNDPEVPAETVETLLLESTYGDRIHDPLPQAIEALEQAIKKVVARGGKIIMPAFSLGRTQMIVYILEELTKAGRLPTIPIFVDSPLATELTAVFTKHPEDYDSEATASFRGEQPLQFKNLKYIGSQEESKGLNSFVGSCIIISASGMMTAGRVMHHLRHTLPDPRHAVFITGYQAQGTLGRRLLEGTTHATIFGDNIPVRAEIKVFNEFSAHADKHQLAAYAGKWRGLKNIFLIHGEPNQADRFRDELQAAHPEWRVTRPDEGESVRL